MRALIKVFCLSLSVLIVLVLTGCPFLTPNAPPVIDIPDQKTQEGNWLILDLHKHANDPDGSSLSFELADGVGQVLEFWHVYEYGPRYGDAGEYDVTIAAVDIREGRSESTFRIIVEEADPPDTSNIDYLRGVAAVSAGGAHSLALGKDGEVWAWGSNEFGQLGEGSNTTSTTPVQVIDHSGESYLEGIIAVSAGAFHSVALRNDGTVWAWGSNLYGQLGNGSTVNSGAPVQVRGPNGEGFLTGIVAVSAGGNHTLALKADGTVWSWGHNLYGQLGIGTTGNTNTPVQVKASAEGEAVFTGVTSIAAGYEHSVALKDNGTVWTWGRNHYGQLGNGDEGEGQYHEIPRQVLDHRGTDHLKNIRQVAAGWVHTVALAKDGKVWSWGRNLHGQLGNGSTSDSSIPVRVLSPGGTGSLQGISEISAGYQHTAVLTEGKSMWIWGKNTFGQLGDSTEVDRPVPVRVKQPDAGSFMSNLTCMDAGGDHTIAVICGESVWTWGRNTSGQLGNGQLHNENLPVRVLAPLEPESEEPEEPDDA